jgi:hypothetical protein
MSAPVGVKRAEPHQRTQDALFVFMAAVLLTGLIIWLVT